jgi:hypothetical protein
VPKHAEPAPRDPEQIIDEQAREIARLPGELERVDREGERLQQERERLRRENERLQDELEAARRAAKGQAAPFSKGALRATPKSPGRKAGRAYGRGATRPQLRRRND